SQRGIGYAVITPRVQAADDRLQYQQLMEDKVPPIASLLKALRNTLVPALATGSLADSVLVGKFSDADAGEPDPYFQNGERSKRGFLRLAWAALYINELIRSGWSHAQILKLFQSSPLPGVYMFVGDPGKPELVIAGQPQRILFTDEGLQPEAS